jgi:hypothetical protein
MIFYALVLVAILVLQFKRELFERLTRRFFDFFPDSVSFRLHSSRDSFIDGLGLIAKPGLFFKALWYSIISWAFSVLTVFICLQMFKLEMGFAEAVLLICVLSIGSMIPTSPGMIGIYQFCCVLVLHGILGQTEEVAGLYGIISHSISYLYVLAIGFIVLTHENLKLADLNKARKKKAEQPLSTSA